jgi:iron-sulfur cluster repair protein YtfE (RIC family)
MSYERLIAEHALIDAALVRLQALVAAPEPDLPAVTIALADLSGELSHHLAHEDSFLYPGLIGSHNAEARRVATRFVQDFEQLRRDWDLYLREWTAECIGEDWDAFGIETVNMIARLDQRVKAENALLYTEALRTGAIPLRDLRAA